MGTTVLQHSLLVSIVVSIPACHAGDRGSIPRRGGNAFFPSMYVHKKAFIDSQLYI